MKIVEGSDYHFNAPADWHVIRTDRAVEVSKGVHLVSVTRFPLLRRYRPDLWTRVVPELDRAATQLSEQQKGEVSDSRTVTIAAQQARRYDIGYERDRKALVERIAFALRGKTEYLLLCRYDRGGDTGACDRLLATFALD